MWSVESSDFTHFLHIFQGLPSRRHGFLFNLTPWSGIHLEKLTGFQLLKKFPAFYGTRRFIAACTTFRRLSLS
jgi:hypothetical protein